MNLRIVKCPPCDLDADARPGPAIGGDMVFHGAFVWSIGRTGGWCTAQSH
jgi:hypothetical protein